jgi:hypothetical protein
VRRWESQELGDGGARTGEDASKVHKGWDWWPGADNILLLPESLQGRYIST